MRYRPEVDGLRALAVVPVLLHHAGVRALPGGFLGVDLFFVISGYLITSLLLGELAEGRFSLAHFYERRARRILPPLFALFALCLPVLWLCFPPAALLDFCKAMAATLGFSSNLLFAHQHGYFDDASKWSLLLHTWSLGVEEQFYLFFPLLLAFFWRRGRRVSWGLAGLVVASLACADVLSRHQPAFAYYGLPTRVWELLAGSLLAAAPRPAPGAGGRALGFVGLALVLVSMARFDASVPHPSAWTLLPVLGTVLLIRYSEEGPLHGLLASRPLVGIGLISYSLYLWHLPLLAGYRVLFREAPPLWLLGLCAALAWLSWRFVERPYRDRARVSRPVLAWSLGGAFGLLMAVGLYGWRAQGLPGRFSPEVQAVFAQQHLDVKALYRLGRCQLDPNEGQLHFGPECGGKRDGGVTLWGDSIASALYPGLQAALPGRSVAQFSVSGCAPVPGWDWRPGSACGGVQAEAFVRILAQEPRTVLVASLWRGDYLRDEAFWSAFRTALLGLKRRGHRVIVLGPPPIWDYPVAAIAGGILARGGSLPADLDLGWDLSYLWDAKVQAAAESARVEYLALKPFTCQGRRCRAYALEGGAPQLWVFDDVHLTPAGSRVYGERLIQALKL